MSDKPDHKSTYYSGKKPYLTHNYRTMMKKKTQEEYYSHELHQDPMSELLKPYWRNPEMPGFGWEYMGPDWWEWPPFSYPGGGGPGAGGVGPYDDDDGLPEQKVCESCEVLGNDSVVCGNEWVGFVLPSECIGWNVFAYGLDDGFDFGIAADASGFIVVVVPSDTTETAMLVCSTSPPPGVTCCKTVGIDCCCPAFTVTGADTVTSGDTWVGTISPACPGAQCNVVSNSGCDISCNVNVAGSQVTVVSDVADCGSFTVTVTSCEETGSKVVRLSEGSWVYCNSIILGGEHHCYGNVWIEGMYRATVDCGTGGFGFVNARDCDGNIIHRFDYIPDCCDGCGGCTTQHFTRGYQSDIWSCTC